MAQYFVDERDMMFNLLECPGLKPIQETGAYDEADEDTLGMIVEQSMGFCQKVLAPLLKESDRASCKLEDGKVLLPESIGEAWEQYKELGMVGINSSPEYGGAGLPHFFSAPVAEMECGSFVAFSMLPLLTRGSARLIAGFGSDELKNLYLENMFTGHWTGTMCLTEPNAGSDVGSGSTKAVKDGDHYKITGTKIFISWGEHEFAENIIHLVLARIEGAPAGTKGLSLFVVPKNRVDADGNITEFNDVVCGTVEDKMGIKASPTCVINFGTNEDCHGYLVGEPQKGIRYMFQMMNEARIEVGIQGLGIAAAAYMSALDYARERTQGVVMKDGKPKAAKIIEHEDVRRMLLKMRAITQGSRALCYHLNQYMDLAEHHPTDKEKYAALVDLLTPICKSYCSDMGFRVTEMAIQTYGGYGYIKEYPVEQYMRDAKISSIYEGTNGIQALDLVFRKILGDGGERLKVWMGEVSRLCSQAEKTDLADLGARLRTAADTVASTCHYFGKQMESGQDAAVRFHATDFQESMGHVMLGYFLLKQSMVALDALSNGAEDHDRNYYEQKIVTTKYFFSDMVTIGVNNLQQISKGEVPGLDATFD